MGWLVMKKLRYDAECPICTTFNNDSASRLGGDVEFIPIEEGAKNFKYQNDKGVYEGKYAISVLMTDFPNLSPSLSILPDEWRDTIATAMYEIASLGRNLYQKINGLKNKLNKKGCNCGK